MTKPANSTFLINSASNSSLSTKIFCQVESSFVLKLDFNNWISVSERFLLFNNKSFGTLQEKGHFFHK